MNLLLVFARTPLAGEVKTRLFSHLTPQEACALHCAMIEDTAELAVSFPGRRLILFSGEVPSMALPAGLETGRQQGEGLGARLAVAFQEGFLSGARKVLAIGSDSPHLPPERLREALEALDTFDLALGPTDDGGYYLIGLRKFAPEILSGVEWGTGRVLEQTLRAAERAGLGSFVMAPFYDLDEWKDLERLAASDLTGARRTRAQLTYLPSASAGRAPIPPR